MDHSSEANIAVLQTSLSRMRSVERILNTLSSSLADTIEMVSSKTEGSFRQVTTRFASLPDELLVRIFELHYRYFNSNSVVCPGSGSIRFAEYRDSPHILACVCKLFRRIALSIPFLWRDVTSSDPEDLVLALKRRCQNPSVHILGCTAEYAASAQVDRFLGTIHSNQNWQELHVHFANGVSGHFLFELFKERVEGPFDGLDTLTYLITTPSQGLATHKRKSTGRLSAMWIRNRWLRGKCQT